MKSLLRGGRSSVQAGSPTSVVAAAMPGGRRAAVTLADQTFSSISNFAVGVAVARVAGASGLGGFSLAYSLWLVLAAVHRSLITDPMAIDGDVRSPTAREGIKRGFAAEILLGLSGTVLFVAVGAALMVLHQDTFAVGMLALGPWLPALLVQDYWRWVGFMSRRPGRSLVNDTVFNCAQGAAFVAVFVAHAHSVAPLIACWGLGGAAGGLWGLRQYRVLPSLAGGLRLLRSRWSFSKWLAGVSITNWGAAQAYVFLAGGILGPVGLGGLRAVQTLATGPSMVLIQAGGSVGLPEASRSYAERGWRGLTRVARVVAGAGIVSAAACCAAVVVWGKPLLRVIYGPAFAHLKLAAVLIGIGNIITAFGIGPILVLKTTRKTRWLFHVQIITLVASLGSVTAMSFMYGVNGAAAATVVTGVAAVAAYRGFQHMAHKSVHAEEAAARAASLVEAGAAEPSMPPQAPPRSDEVVVVARGEASWNGRTNGSAHPDEKPETGKGAAWDVHAPRPTVLLDGSVLHRSDDASSSRARSSRNLGNQWFVPAGGRRRLATRARPRALTVNEQPLDLRAALTAVRRRRALVSSLVLLGLVAGVGYATALPPMPSAIALVLLPSSTSTSVAPDTRTDTLLATSVPVLAEAGASVRPNLSPTVLKKRVVATALSQDIIQIRASAPNGAEAERLANAVASDYIRYVTATGSASSRSTLSELQLEAKQLSQQIQSLQDQINAASARLATEGAASPDGQRDASLLGSLRNEQGEVSLELDNVNSQIVTAQLSGPLAGSSMRILQSATSVVLPSKLRPVVLGVLGAAIGLLLGCILALLSTLRDRRLRLRDEVAGAIGVPVLASLQARRCKSVEDWTLLLRQFRPSPVDAWSVRRVLHHLAAEDPEVRPHLRVVVFADDGPSIAAGAQLARSAGATGVTTALVPGQHRALVQLRAACAVLGEPFAVDGIVTFAAEGAHAEAGEATLTVSVLAVDGTKPELPGADGPCLLAVSSGFATNEDLARVALAANEAGRSIDGILMVNPEASDSTTGMVSHDIGLARAPRRPGGRSTRETRVGLPR